MRNSRRLFLGAAGLALLLVLSACQPGGVEQKPTLTVGVSGAFAENQIVAEMYAQVLEDAGYTINRQLDIRSREISQPALENGEIDVKPEYLGTLLLFLDKNATATSDPQENADKIADLLEPKGITLLEFSQANDTNAIVVTPDTAREHSLSAVSDLQPVAGQLIFGGPPECPQRPFCLPGLQQTYGIQFKEFKPLDVGGALTVAALEQGAIDVALLFSTSGVISNKGWVLLEDDKGLQTADNIAPVVRDEVLNDEIRSLLNSVSAKLTTENITELNAEVEIDNKDPADVAQAFLEEEGLL
jgi:osmoprotectant transport system substrate-binding protein